MMELEKFRTRWLRWLGQKTRVDRFDKPPWVALLDCNWKSWATSTLDKHSIGFNWLPVLASREKVKEYYTLAIKCADMEDLGRLDNLFAIELVEKLVDWK